MISTYGAGRLSRTLVLSSPVRRSFTAGSSTTAGKRIRASLAAPVAFAVAATAIGTTVDLLGRRAFGTSAVLCEEESKTEKTSSTGFLSNLPSFDLPSLPDSAALSTLRTWSNNFSQLTDSFAELQREFTGGTGSSYSRIIAGKDDRQRHPELEFDAKVRIGPELAQAERAFLRERKRKMRTAFADYLKVDVSEVDERDIPIISCAGSGGGYRAMIATLSSLQAFKHAGIFDCLTYVSAVSGSCWALNMLYSVGGGDVDRTLQHIRQRITQPFLDPATVPILTNKPTNEYLLEGAILKQAAKGGEISVVDAYGTLISSRLYVPPEKEKDLNPKHLKMSSQREYTDSGSLPLPIYCAIRHELPHPKQAEKENKKAKEAMTKAAADAAKGKREELIAQGRWQWFEFTPYEVGCDELSAWIPTWSLGRRFENGENVERIPELSLTIMTGMFGSAFCATLFSYFKEIRPVLRALPFFDKMDEFVNERRQDLESIHPVPPAELPNFLKGMKGKLRKGASDDVTEHDTLGFMDAGAELNLPYVPLYRRDCDVIIALDASADSQELWFENAAKYAKQRKLKSWPRVDWKTLFKPEGADAAAKEDPPEKNVSKSDVKNSAADKAADKVDSAKSQETEAIQNEGNPKKHDSQQINPQTPPVGSAPESVQHQKERMPESQQNEPPLGACNIWVGSTLDEDSPCRNDSPTTEDVLARDGICLVYLPLLPTESFPNPTEAFSTWKFEYPVQETDKMTALCHENFSKGEEQIKNLIRGVWERKKRDRKRAETAAAKL